MNLIEKIKINNNYECKGITLEFDSCFEEESKDNNELIKEISKLALKKLDERFKDLKVLKNFDALAIYNIRKNGNNKAYGVDMITNLLPIHGHIHF